jgi:hypothetical protein
MHYLSLIYFASQPLRLYVNHSVVSNNMYYDIQSDSLASGPKLLSTSLLVCLDVKGDHFQHRLSAGPVLHHSRYVYINFQAIISIT